MRKVPRVSVTTKSVKGLSAAEYAQLRRSGHHPGAGCIREDLIMCRMLGMTAKVVMAKTRDGRIRSWALIDLGFSKPTVMYWTQYRWRRIGLGSKVAARVHRILGGQNYYHSELDSPQFFKAIGAVAV